MSDLEKHTFNYYGCPETEMWTNRFEFEDEHPELDLSMKKDAPHYNSGATRIAYFAWEKK